ncbi:putative Ankyrin repeat and FYVE domain-containing protein [Naja naja]|nr:putative Ankyrin repeat and FYVE domain-containing protein [Naja naja]
MLLRLLLDRCEKGVMSLVNVRNCIRFYQTAEELNASTLMNYCAEIIANHWLPGKLNELDHNGDLALDLALCRRLESIATTLVNHKADVDMMDKKGWSLLHKAIQRGDKFAANFLIKNGARVNAAILGDQETPLHLVASYNSKKHKPEVMTEMAQIAESLLRAGANPNMQDSQGRTPLHSSIVVRNDQGETPLHTACQHGLANLTAELLQQGANPNIQTEKAAPAPKGTVMPGTADSVSLQTPLHMAIAYNHPDVVSVILEQKANALHATNNLQIIPDFSLKDSRDQTVLGLALWTGMHKIAAQLLGSGASINDTMSDGQTLLHMAIQRQDSKSALFLLEHQAISVSGNKRTQDGETALQLAIKNQLPLVVDAICTRGADMSVPDEKGNPPLWLALENNLEDIASTLVRHGCDATFWGPGPSGCLQTLLHRAIDENSEQIACFLIRSGCDVNSPRQPGANGEGDEEAHDRQTPLHLAACWGLEETVQCLLEFGANVNAQDAEGKTPIHVAIINQHNTIIQMMISHSAIQLNLRDRQGLTPFACAMTYKNNKAAEAILKREPGAAEQVDNKGRNFLHLAVQNSDIESVLFLISVQADVNSRVQDTSKLTPLHLAVQAGSEIIVRNLLLAGARISELNKHRQTALHLAAQQDLPTICSVLLENGIDFAAVDENKNNALHLAVMHGRLSNIRVLLTECNIDAEAINASAPFGYTGNANLCRAIVRAGARLGINNNQGINIFNYQVATKQLLFRLLGKDVGKLHVQNLP